MNSMAQIPNVVVARERPAREAGFVMPFVLLMIAGLSLIAAAAFATVSRAAAVMQALDDSAAADTALASAEAQSTFAFLTARPAPQGFDLVGGVPLLDGLSDPDVAGAAPPISSLFWRADGAIKRIPAGSREVIVQLRDAAGLFPLRTASEDDMARFFSLLGMSPDDAERMAARVGDYQDADNIRRFKGAERADYRLFDRDPPANAPLRAPDELGRVAGMVAAAPPLFWQDLADLATIEPGTLMRYAAPPPLAPFAVSRTADPGDIDAIAASADIPSGRARFLLTVSEGPEPGSRVRLRAVDIRRPFALSQAPMQRYWVSERTRDFDPRIDNRSDGVPVLDAGAARVPQ